MRLTTFSGRGASCSRDTAMPACFFLRISTDEPPNGPRKPWSSRWQVRASGRRLEPNPVNPFAQQGHGEALAVAGGNGLLFMT